MWVSKPMRDTDAATVRVSDPGQVERASAFRRLAEDHIEDSYRLASFILGSPSEARDAVHDAFITAWRRWEDLRDQGRFEPWFKRIVVNACKDRLRRAARQRTAALEEYHALETPDVSGGLHDKLLVEQALALLKPDDQVILGLRYYRDLALADIARILDLPVGTVKSRLNHAHSRLRTAIERLQRGAGSR